MTEFKYRPDVDGLRALAVVLVLLFHANLGLTGGFVGVDVFFVISGFLITGLVLNEQRVGKFRLVNFWIRRIRRIIPAATVMVVVVLLAGAVFLLPGDYEDLARSVISQQLLVANHFFWRSTGYFEGPADLKPLLHTWSLAVEEQFYLAYPFLLVFLRRVSRRSAILVLAVMAILSLAVSEYAVRHYPAAAFYLLPARAWELLLGGLICFTPAPSAFKYWQLNVLSAIGIGGIVLSGFLFSSRTPFPGLAGLLPCVATAAVIYSNALRLTWVGRLLAAGPVVLLGLISYSLYLWHWPVLTFLRYWSRETLDPRIAIVALLVSLVIALLSWRFVETTFRRPRKNGSKVATPYVAAIASAAVVVGLALVVRWTNGAEFRLSERARRYVAADSRLDRYETSVVDAQNLRFPVVGPLDADTAPIGLLVWGDSHAMAVGDLTARLAQKHGVSAAIAAHRSVAPLLGVWRPRHSADERNQQVTFNQAVFDYVLRKKVTDVLLVARWEAYVEGQVNGDLEPLIGDEASRGFGPEESEAALFRGLERTLTALTRAGVRVWILGQVPLQSARDPNRLLVFAVWRNKAIPSGVSLQEHLQRQARVLKVMAQLPTGQTFLDPARVCFDALGNSRIGDERGSYYRDLDHVSSHGAEMLLAPLLDTLFARITAEKVSRPSLPGGASASGTPTLGKRPAP